MLFTFPIFIHIIQHSQFPKSAVAADNCNNRSVRLMAHCSPACACLVQLSCELLTHTCSSHKHAVQLITIYWAIQPLVNQTLWAHPVLSWRPYLPAHSIIISCKMNARVIGADRSCARYTLAIMCHHQLCMTTANSKIGFTNHIWCGRNIPRLLFFCLQDSLHLLCQSHPGRQK